MANGSTRDLRAEVHRLAAEIFADSFDDAKQRRFVNHNIDKMSRSQLIATLDSVNGVDDWGDLAEDYDEVYDDGENPWYYHA